MESRSRYLDQHSGVRDKLAPLSAENEGFDTGAYVELNTDNARVAEVMDLLDLTRVALVIGRRADGIMKRRMYHGGRRPRRERSPIG